MIYTLADDRPDDEFYSFITAPVAPSNPTPAPAAAPIQTLTSNVNANANIFKILDSAQSRPMPTNTTGGSFSQSPLNNMGLGMGLGHRSTMSGSGGQFPSFTSQPMQPQKQFGGAAQPIQPFTSTTTVKPVQPQPQAKPASSSNFDDLWSMSLGNTKSKPVPLNTKSIKDLEKEKSQAGLWGAQQQQKPPTMGMGLGSNGGFGSFSNAAPQNSSGDDLLL